MLTQLSSWRLPSAPTYLISHDHVPGPESTFRFVPLWHTVEVILGRLTGLPWRWRDWAYWLENVLAKSSSTRPRVVSGVQPPTISAAATSAPAARMGLGSERSMGSTSRDVAAPERHVSDSGRDHQIQRGDDQPARQRRGVRGAVEQPPPRRHRVAQQGVTDGVPRVEERVELHAEPEDDRDDHAPDAAAGEDRDHHRDRAEAQRRQQHRRPARRDEARGRRAWPYCPAHVDER